MATKDKRVDLTTGVGTLSFPHVFASTKSSNDDGEDVYDIQIIIPKSQRDDVRAILAAIKEVGEDKWGDNWKSVRLPLRDGDKERNDITDDGQTKGEKYPERLGCFFINARSRRPVPVIDRQRVPINNPDDLYGGCKGKIAVTFYPYAQKGNTGIGVGLNGVQKVTDGDPFGGGAPAVESMFDLIEEDDDMGLDDVEDAPVEVAKPAAKKTAAKKAVAKKAAPAPEPEEDEDDLGLDDDDDAGDDPYDDI